MDGSSIILSHWQKEVDEFNKNLLLLRARFVPDAVHDLRVAIKKLKSYLTFSFAFIERRNVEPLFVSTTELFAVLGRYRNIDISRQLVLKYAGKNPKPITHLLVYLETLQEQTAEFSRAAIDNYDNGDLLRLTGLLEEKLKEVNPEEIERELGKSIGSSLKDAHRNGRHFNDKYHLVRKDLKAVLYASKILRKKSPLNSSQVASIDKVLNQLGNIQDHTMLLRNLKNFRKAIVARGMPEYDRVEKLESVAKKRKDTLLKSANRIMTHESWTASNKKTE